VVYYNHGASLHTAGCGALRSTGPPIQRCAIRRQTGTAEIEIAMGWHIR